MGKTVEEAIDDFVAEINAMEAAIRDKKKVVNTLCVVAHRDEMYVLDEAETGLPTRIRPDQFYGQALATAVRTILEMRKQQNLGAATVKEIFEALTAGGYQFQTKSDEVAHASLRNSLSKNTVTFHKLPNGRFGLLSWYPNAKQPKSSNGGGNNGIDIDTDTDETETATEGSVADS